jgi:hypothetical protein
MGCRDLQEVRNNVVVLNHVKLLPMWRIAKQWIQPNRRPCLTSMSPKVTWADKVVTNYWHVELMTILYIYNYTYLYIYTHIQEPEEKQQHYIRDANPLGVVKSRGLPLHMRLLGWSIRAWIQGFQSTMSRLHVDNPDARSARLRVPTPENISIASYSWKKGFLQS